MGYIGQKPAESFTSFATQTFSTSATSSYTLDHAVTNENELALFINNVRQQPGSGNAYTATGTALTLSANTASTDTMYAVFLGRALQTVNPAGGSVGSSQIAAEMITGQTALSSAPADTDEFLISDAGVLKRIDYSLIKGGGQWTHLLTSTASSSSSIAFSSTYITTTYLDYMIVCSGIKTSADGATAQIRMSTDNGSSYLSAYRAARHAYGSDDAAVHYGANSAGAIYIQGSSAIGNSTGEGFSSVIHIFDPLKQSGTTGSRTILTAQTAYHDQNTDITISNIAGSNKVDTAVNNIKFDLDSGNIASGKVSLYGRKLS